MFNTHNNKKTGTGITGTICKLKKQNKWIYKQRDEKEGNLKQHVSEMYIKNTDRQTDRQTDTQAGRQAGIHTQT